MRRFGNTCIGIYMWDHDDGDVAVRYMAAAVHYHCVYMQLWDHENFTYTLCIHKPFDLEMHVCTYFKKISL